MWMRCVLAAYEGLTGHKEKALAQLQEILSLAEHRYVSPVHLSMANCYFTNVHRQNSERFQNE